MSDAMFLIREGKLVELADRPYDSEDLLQMWKQGKPFQAWPAAAAAAA
jgi:hypothetical protein